MTYRQTEIHPEKTSIFQDRASRRNAWKELMTRKVIYNRFMPTAERDAVGNTVIVNQYFTATEAAAHSEARDRIRVLVVAPDPLGSPLSPLSIAAEWNAFANLARRFDHPVAIIRLNPPTFRNLQAATADSTHPFDIIHFIAHGDGTHLALETLGGGLDRRPYDQIAECLARSKVQVVIFNVCKSLPLADALRAARSDITCIAAEGNVPDRTAVDFAEGLYAGLFGRQPMAEALKMGARAMNDEGIYVCRGDIGARPLRDVIGEAGPALFSGDPPHNSWLPGYTPGGFVGRVDELRDDVYPFLRPGNDRAALFVTGIGGIGKTALAMAAARRYGWLFPAGVVSVTAKDVINFGVSKVIEAIDSALGTEAGGSPDPASAALESLNRESHLLILDNLETMESVEAKRELAKFVAQVEAESGSRVILTMRPRAMPEFADAVRFGELRAGPLARAEAIRVLESRAQPDGLAKLKGHEVEVAEAAFLHPSLLTFAAGRLHLAPLNTVLSWLRELRGDALDREIPARLGAMVADVEKVAPGAARVLCTLSAFSGGATEEALRAVHGEDDEDKLQKILVELVKGNLADLDRRERYSVQSLVAQWARQHGPYTHDEWGAVEKRNAEHFLEWARKYKPGQEAKWREYDVELENIVAGAEWVFAQDKAEYAKLICDYADALTPIIYFRRLAEGKAWLMAGLQAAQSSGDQKGEALFCNELGVWHDARGDYEAALEWYQKSLSIREELGDWAGLAATYSNIGLIHKARSDYDTALEWYQKDLVISEELGDRAGLAVTYNNIGGIHYARGDYDAALGWLQKSLAIQEALGDRAGLATTLHNMGNLALAQNDLSRALELFTRSRDVSAAIGLEKKVAEEEEMMEEAKRRMEEGHK